MIGRESNRDRGIRQNLRQIWAVFEGEAQKAVHKYIDKQPFPRRFTKTANYFQAGKSSGVGLPPQLPSNTDRQSRSDWCYPHPTGAVLVLQGR